MNAGDGELKCLQKTSTVALTVNGGNFFYKAKFSIPEEYPEKFVGLNEHKTNFPDTLLRFLNGQSKEIARQCVEVKHMRWSIYNEVCPVCGIKCLPAKPSEVEVKDISDHYIERVYCGHIYHLGCLRSYHLPPFPRSEESNKSRKPNQLNKEDTCGVRISHDRWALAPKLAKARWAQQQARERELEEVKDFLQ